MSRRGNKLKKDLYQVQAIIDKKFIQGKLNYKVLWKGYKEDLSSFEPLQNLTTVQDMIEIYEQQQAQKTKAQQVPASSTIQASNVQTVESTAHLNSTLSKQKSRGQAEFPTKKRKNDDVPVLTAMPSDKKVCKNKQGRLHSETKPQEVIPKTTSKLVANKDIQNETPKDSLDETSMLKKRQKKSAKQKGILKLSLSSQSANQRPVKDHKKVVSFPKETSSQNQLPTNSVRFQSKSKTTTSLPKPPHNSPSVPQEDPPAQLFTRINHHIIKNQKVMYQVQYNPLCNKKHIDMVSLDQVPVGSMKMFINYYENRMLMISQEPGN